MQPSPPRQIPEREEPAADWRRPARQEPARSVPGLPSGVRGSARTARLLRWFV